MAKDNGASNRVFLRSAYVPDAERPVYDPGGPSMTRQEFAQDCDVNEILRRHPNVGILGVVNGSAPVYYDFTSAPDNLLDSLNVMMEAEDAFMRLPAEARREFDNDPVRFVEYAANRDNLPQLRKWGLAEPEKPEAPPQKVEVVNPSPPVSPEPKKAPTQ